MSVSLENAYLPQAHKTVDRDRRGAGGSQYVEPRPGLSTGEGHPRSGSSTETATSSGTPSASRFARSSTYLPDFLILDPQVQTISNPRQPGAQQADRRPHHRDVHLPGHRPRPAHPREHGRDRGSRPRARLLPDQGRDHPEPLLPTLPAAPVHAVARRRDQRRRALPERQPEPVYPVGRRQPAALRAASVCRRGRATRSPSGSS